MNEKKKTHHHAYISSLIAIHFYCVVNHQVHKLIKTTKCSNYHTICIHLNCKFKPEKMIILLVQTSIFAGNTEFINKLHNNIIQEAIMGMNYRIRFEINFLKPPACPLLFLQRSNHAQRTYKMSSLVLDLQVTTIDSM